MDVPKALAEAAARLALDINANAILALTETGKNCSPLFKKNLVGTRGREVKVVLATPSHETYKRFSGNPRIKLIKLTARAQGRSGQAHHAMACGLREKIFFPGERLVCLAGNGFADSTDALLVMQVSENESIMETVESDPVLAAATEISLELGKGTSGGKPVGTAFVIGDSKAVLRISHQLMINPFKSYLVNITDRKQWELIKKYATFDGAFVVGNDGRVITAERYLNASIKVEIPHGLGTRHLAVAAMTAATKSRGVTVSGEDGMVRIFRSGKLVAKVDPHSGILESLREV
ncbi:Diadenylate cyclase [subsurface metagenome]